MTPPGRRWERPGTPYGRTAAEAVGDEAGGCRPDGLEEAESRWSVGLAALGRCPMSRSGAVPARTISPSPAAVCPAAVCPAPLP